MVDNYENLYFLLQTNPLFFLIIMAGFYLVLLPLLSQREEYNTPDEVSDHNHSVRVFALILSFFQLSIFLWVWNAMDLKTANVQLKFVLWGSDLFNAVFGVEVLGFYFIFLSVLLLPICILTAWVTVSTQVELFHIFLFLINFLLIIAFSCQDLFFFYVAFESILIPMFLIIGVWGSRDRKIHASYQFFLYTLVGSICMLVSILYIYFQYGSVDVEFLKRISFGLDESRLLWLALFLAFAVKVPMFPFHIWLPEAHVEAPTTGSLLLAGILLKLGGYGFLRFLIPIFPEATQFFQPLVFVLCLVGVVYCGLSTIRQIDLKKIIAYSSIGHMSYVVLGIFSGTVSGIEGGIFLMIGHGFVSCALFLCVGLLYERYHTRVVLYYGGLTTVMPLLSAYFLFFTLANVALPGTSNFVGELCVLLGLFQVSTGSAVIAATAVLISAVYAFWLYNRVMFGPLRLLYISSFSDLNRREFFLLFLFFLFVMIFGIFPSFILDGITPYALGVVDKFL